MARFQRARDPSRPGQLLLSDGEPVGLVFWAHDYAERNRTGWFLQLLDGEGEGDDPRPRRLTVSADVAVLVRDSELDRRAWLAQAETLELVTAPAAMRIAEAALDELLGLRGT